MRGDGRHRHQRPRIEIRQTSVTPQEAGAIAAAMERFLRERALVAKTPATAAVRPWLRAGLLESAGIVTGAPTRWRDPEPWGRFAA